jgi:hypothetical protein
VADSKFTLRTNHKNLLYINSEPNSKVTRWKLLIQNYDFLLEYIPGPQNFVADAFSRLVAFAGTEEELHLLEEFNIPSDKFKIIGQVHNSMVGHFGVEKTIAKLIENDPTSGQPRVEPWPFMREHIKRFIQRCPVCQLQSQSTIKIQTANFTTAASEPNERVNIDSIGPLEPDEHGNTHIIVIIDCFTRWVELYAVQNASALPAARALLSHFGRYGQPHQLVSDNGTQFANEVVSEIIKLIGIEHVFTVPYSHEENAIVERANKEVMRHLRALIFDSKTFSNWSDNLPFVQRIMNTAVHESIGISPAQLLLGHSSSFDKGIFIPKEILREKDLPLSEWVSKRMEQQKLLIEKAKETQHEIDTGHLAQRAKKRNLETNTSTELQDSNGAEPKQKQIKKSGIKIIPDNFPIGSFVSGLTLQNLIGTTSNLS